MTTIGSGMKMLQISKLQHIRKEQINQSLCMRLCVILGYAKKLYYNFFANIFLVFQIISTVVVVFVMYLFDMRFKKAAQLQLYDV